MTDSTQTTRSATPRNQDKVARFRTTIDAVAVAMQCRVPVLLVGDPGNAKTSIVESLMHSLCVDHETSIAALYDPPYYGGYPVPSSVGEDRVVALMPNNWVLRLARSSSKGLVGLFFDELSSAPTATRAAMLRGVLESRWGEVDIPNCCCVAAMNPAHIAEAGIELSAPVANRFLHIDWNPPTEWWTEQMLLGFPGPTFPKLPADRSRFEREARVLWSAYAVRFPGSIQDCPQSADARGGAWPSFRSSTAAMKLYAACMSLGHNPDADLVFTLMSACVGEGMARQLITYANELDIPDPEELLKDPSRVVLPERGDRAFAVLASVTAAVLADNTPVRWCRAWDVLAIAVDSGKGAASATAARMLASNRPSGIKQTPKALDAFVPMLTAAGLMGQR